MLFIQGYLTFLPRSRTGSSLELPRYANKNNKMLTRIIYQFSISVLFNQQLFKEFTRRQDPISEKRQLLNALIISICLVPDSSSDLHIFSLQQKICRCIRRWSSTVISAIHGLLQVGFPFFFISHLKTCNHSHLSSQQHVSFCKAQQAVLWFGETQHTRIKCCPAQSWSGRRRSSVDCRDLEI